MGFWGKGGWALSPHSGWHLQAHSKRVTWSWSFCSPSQNNPGHPSQAPFALPLSPCLLPQASRALKGTSIFLQVSLSLFSSVAQS